MREAPWEHQPITVSIGVAETRHPDMTAADLVNAADTAMYAAKAAGRNCYVRRSETA